MKSDKMMLVASRLRSAEVMMNLKLAMQFGSSSFSAEGSEQFILDAYEKWIGLAESERFSKIAGTSGADASRSADNVGLGGQYENVFDEIDGKLKIIAQMPGSNKADRARSTALTLLFGKLLRGQQSTSADDLREACQDQGCYDASNFASHLKGLKDKVAMNTKVGGGYDIKLTAPGRRAAQELVEGLNR